MTKEIIIGWLTSDLAKIIKQTMRESGLPLGNDFYYIQYKDGSICVYDRGYDEDKLPSLAVKDILYIYTWFGYTTELYINPKLNYFQVKNILLNELYDEYGNLFYDIVNTNRDFHIENYNM